MHPLRRSCRLCRTLSIMSGTDTNERPATPVAEPPPGLLRSLINRFRHLLQELGKFGVVGAIAYVVDTVAFKIALSALNPLLAKTVATVISATVAFIGNRNWTWRDRPRSGLRREYTLYFVFNVVGLAIGLACLGLSHYLLGNVWPVFRSQAADLISANFFGVALGTLFRFWSYRRFVFRAHNVTVDSAGVETK
jgi:putative flippase GtrA